MNDPEDVQRLIRLKRYESPGDEYFSSFMEEFKERQRSEMLRVSARSLLFERVAMWFEESGGAKRFVPAGAVAAAALGAGLYFVTSSSDRPASAIYAAAPVADTAVGIGKFPAGVVAEDEIIRLKLPERSVRVPGLGAEAFPSGMLPAGVRSNLREL